VRLLACVGVLAAGCSSGDDDAATDTTEPTATTTAPSTISATVVATTLVVATTQPLPTEGLIAEIEVLGGPDWLEADEHGVWAKLDNGSLVLIAPATNSIADTVDVDVGGELCQGLGAGDGSIWACSGTGVARIDASHPEVLSVLPVNKAYTQGEIGVAEGQLWVLQGDGSILMGYLTDTQDEWSRFSLPVRGTDLGVGEAGLWVLSSVDGAVVHVDMDTGRASDTIALTGPLDVAVDHEVWVATSNETVRIDAAGAIDLRVPVGIGASGSIVLTPGEVWIRNLDPLLTRVNRTTGEVIDTYTADVTSGGDSVYAFESVWTSAADDATIFRFAAPA
jgi:hypothetical protein